MIFYVLAKHVLNNIILLVFLLVFHKHGSQAQLLQICNASSQILHFMIVFC